MSRRYLPIKVADGIRNEVIIESGDGLDLEGSGEVGQLWIHKLIRFDQIDLK